MPGSTCGAGAPRGEEEGGRGAGPLQLLCFVVAFTALTTAIVSPIDGLGEDYLFSMHMLQHILLGDIAPVFLLLRCRA